MSPSMVAADSTRVTRKRAKQEGIDVEDAFNHEGKKNSQAALHSDEKKMDRTPQQFTGLLLYCSSEKDVENACSKIQEASISQLGFDMEWRVFFRKGDNQGLVALIQLCAFVKTLGPLEDLPWRFIDKDGIEEDAGVDASASSASSVSSAMRSSGGHGTYVCFLFHVCHSSVTPRLKEILTDGSISKSGVNISGDAKKLSRDYGVDLAGQVELCQMGSEELPARWAGRIPKRASLAALSKVFLGKELDKNKKVRLGNWERLDLNHDKKMYAATDAFASLRIYEEMKNIIASCQ